MNKPLWAIWGVSVAISVNFLLFWVSQHGADATWAQIAKFLFTFFSVGVVGWILLQVPMWPDKRE